MAFAEIPEQAEIAPAEYANYETNGDGRPTIFCEASQGVSVQIVKFDAGLLPENSSLRKVIYEPIPNNPNGSHSECQMRTPNCTRCIVAHVAKRIESLPAAIAATDVMIRRGEVFPRRVEFKPELVQRMALTES